MFRLAKKNLFLIVIIDNNVDNNSNYQKQEKETLIDHRCWLLSVFNAVILQNSFLLSVGPWTTKILTIILQNVYN